MSAIPSNIDPQTDSAFFSIPPDSQREIVLSVLSVEPRSIGRIQQTCKLLYKQTSDEIFDKNYWEAAYKKDFPQLPSPCRGMSFQQAYKIHQNIISRFIQNPSLVQNRLLPEHLDELFRQALLRDHPREEENYCLSKITPLMKSAKPDEVRKIINLIPDRILFNVDEVQQHQHYMNVVYLHNRYFKEGTLDELKEMVKRMLLYGMERRRTKEAPDNPYKEFVRNKQVNGLWAALLSPPTKTSNAISEKSSQPAPAPAPIDPPKEAVRELPKKSIWDFLASKLKIITA